MPISGLEVDDEALNGHVAVLSGNDGLGKPWLPVPVTPKEVQASLWDMFWTSLRKKLGL